MFPAQNKQSNYFPRHSCPSARVRVPACPWSPPLGPHTGLGCELEAGRPPGWLRRCSRGPVTGVCSSGFAAPSPALGFSVSDAKLCEGHCLSPGLPTTHRVRASQERPRCWRPLTPLSSPAGQGSSHGSVLEGGDPGRGDCFSSSNSPGASWRVIGFPVPPMNVTCAVTLCSELSPPVPHTACLLLSTSETRRSRRQLSGHPGGQCSWLPGWHLK